MVRATLFVSNPLTFGLYVPTPGILLRPQRRSIWKDRLVPLDSLKFRSGTFHHPNVMIYDDFLPTFHKIHSMFLHSMLLRCCVAPYTVGYTERCPTSYHRSTLRLCRQGAVDISYRIPGCSQVFYNFHGSKLSNPDDFQRVKGRTSVWHPRPNMKRVGCLSLSGFK